MPRRDYRAKLAADNAAALRRSRSDRDIASDYPPPGDLARRAACERDFRRFCETYFPNAFRLAWSEDHLRVIARMQDAVLNGGLFALAMPRGSGKTTLCERAALWALLYGHRRFVCLVGASEKRAAELLEHLKTELTCNDILAADFRQVCYPLRRLENNARKCVGQLFRGEQTRIVWSADRLTFPTMPDDACDGLNVSGSTVSVVGLTGALRGQSHTLSTGEVIRPELVILDDPQTRESAMSPSQSAERAAIINGDVLGMAGPGRKIAAIMPCTVIRAGDMADMLLDRQQCPRWQGERCKMLYAMPKNEKLWEQYARLRAESFRKGGNGSEATAFYAEHRAEMDEGAVVAWPARYNPDELSAIQHAMNLRFDDEAAFQAEYQNEPIRREQGDDQKMTADQIAAKLNRLPRRVVPIGCNHLTMFIDVQANLLFYVVAAWEDDFTGYVIDYGTFPDQKRQYFTLRDARHTLATATKAGGLEGAIYAGLEALTHDCLGREWQRDDGAMIRVERCLIDANWGASTDVVYQFCRQSPHAAILLPSHGRFVGASSRPFSEYRHRPGDRVGLNWRIPTVQGKRAVRHVIYDTNFWKSFIFARLSVEMGSRGCLSLFGDKPETHRLFAEHLTAEYRVKTEGRGRVVDEWKLRPERPDNHWLDCLVGCAVAASIQGVSLGEFKAESRTARGRVSFASMQRSRKLRYG